MSDKAGIAAIVCVERDFGIGKNGNLLVQIPDDMKRFAELTAGSVVIAGRKTMDSVPGGLLKERTNLVITRQSPKNNPFHPIPGKRNSISMEQAKEYLQNINHTEQKENVFIIGGAQAYKELLQYCQRLYVTQIFQHFDADTYFPNIKLSSDWDIESLSNIRDFKGILYQFIVYKRRNTI